MKRTCTRDYCSICKEAVERQTITIDSNGIIHTKEETETVHGAWLRGYITGHKEGREAELERVRELVNRYLYDREHD